MKFKKLYFLIPVLFVVIVKIPHLGLPFFWDEAWSYFPAIYKMYESGPGLLPGAIPISYSKGHPLFFYFLFSSWISIYPDHIFFTRILALIIALLTLLTVYLFLKKHVSNSAANIGVTLLSVQSIFLAQSTFVLPEMLIALLLLLSLHFFVLHRFLLFSLFASLMVLTKETSIIYIPAFALLYLIYSKNFKTNYYRIILNIAIISIPVLVYCIFLILHYSEFGVFFFKEHIDFVDFTQSEILRKLKSSFALIFLRYGRNTLFFPAIILLIYFLFRKKQLLHSKLIIITTSLIFIFFVFSSFNFYIHRYILNTLPLFIISFSILFDQFKPQSKYIKPALLAILSSVCLYYSFTKKMGTDIDLGYVDVVKVHEDVVHFCEEQSWQDKNIAASFNMIFCLRDPHLGYISGKNGFVNVNGLENYYKSEIFILESTVSEDIKDVEKIRKNEKLLKRFEKNHAWGEIYIKANNSVSE